MARPASLNALSRQGGSYRYEFIASLYGTSWYHAHYSAQYSAGVVGPIVVYGPTKAHYDIDLGPIMLSGGLNYFVALIPSRRRIL